jgi:hypothetical protein
MLCAFMGGLLVWMLAGCAHHRDQARDRGGYYEKVVSGRFSK